MSPENIPSLATRRLLLRPLQPADVSVVFALRSDEAALRYLSRPKCESEAEASMFIEQITEGCQQGRWLYWAVAERVHNAAIGTICLWNLNPELAQAEIGYELLRSRQRQGLMQEAAAAVIGYGFAALELRKLLAYSHEENEPSRRLLLRLGFRLAERETAEKILSKMVCYRLLRSEYEN